MNILVDPRILYIFKLGTYKISSEIPNFQLCIESQVKKNYSELLHSSHTNNCFFCRMMISTVCI